uniref:Uncharacterized protein n=1 Tax=Timema douglasi TaxID=61478 RepID=A0A7R8VCC3_TIMDO|nr:unnamed protein product [Timema douglasi]
MSCIDQQYYRFIGRREILVCKKMTAMFFVHIDRPCYMHDEAYTQCRIKMETSFLPSFINKQHNYLEPALVIVWSKASLPQETGTDDDWEFGVRILTMESCVFEKVAEYLTLIGRTELLTCSATQNSFGRIRDQAQQVSTFPKEVAGSNLHGSTFYPRIVSGSKRSF